jgi:multiple sugar transport system substrate-binding protein/putative aldouronate transport system substrate-binding protein
MSAGRPSAGIHPAWAVELNIIPATEGTYATRMAASNLGDLVVWGGNDSEFTTAIEANLLLDWNKSDILDR